MREQCYLCCVVLCWYITSLEEHVTEKGNSKGENNNACERERRKRERGELVLTVTQRWVDGLGERNGIEWRGSGVGVQCVRV